MSFILQGHQLKDPRELHKCNTRKHKSNSQKITSILIKIYLSSKVNINIKSPYWDTEFIAYNKYLNWSQLYLTISNYLNNSLGSMSTLPGKYQALETPWPTNNGTG